CLTGGEHADRDHEVSAQLLEMLTKDRLGKIRINRAAVDFDASIDVLGYERFLGRVYHGRIPPAISAKAAMRITNAMIRFGRLARLLMARSSIGASQQFTAPCVGHGFAIG